MQMRFSLIGRDQKRKQQIDGLVVDSIKGDGGSSWTNTPTAAAYPLRVYRGNGNPVANPGTAHFLTGKDRLEHHLGGKPNCFAASSLMISSARFCSGSEPGYGYIPG
jgi:hypothetical protein